MPNEDRHPMIAAAARLGGPALLQWHHENGVEISVADYLNRYQAIRFAGMEGAQRIYLDTNFWVRIRDAYLGLRDGVWVDLLHVLQARVRDRSAICLLNYWNFTEIARQPPERLRRTCELVDELCEGISLASPEDLQELQAADYVTHVLGFDDDSARLSRWTCIARLHRTALPPMPAGMRPDQLTAMTKTVWDTLIAASMKDLMESLGWDTEAIYGARHIDEHTIGAVEALKAKRIAQGLSRQQIRTDEFRVLMHEHYAPIFTRHVLRIRGRQQLPLGLAEVRAAVDSVIARAEQEFRHDQLGVQLPHASLMSELTALYFANAKIGRLTDNDYVDWQHAAAALPHSHLFLTERRLRAQLADLRAGERYGCVVFSNETEALDYLRNA